MTKREAQAAAARLLKMLKGKGWKSRIWENIGWHIECSLGGMKVYSHGDKFSCLLSGEGERGAGGSMYWHDQGADSKDPNKVVARQLKMAREFVDKVEAVVSKLEKATA